MGTRETPSTSREPLQRGEKATVYLGINYYEGGSDKAKGTISSRVEPPPSGTTC